MPTGILRSPYESLEPAAFWRTGIVGHEPGAIPNLYKRKFPITRSMAVATAGSCFAQHIARNLRSRNFAVIDAELPPETLDEKTASRYGALVMRAILAKPGWSGDETQPINDNAVVKKSRPILEHQG